MFEWISIKMIWIITLAIESLVPNSKDVIARLDAHARSIFYESARQRAEAQSEKFCAFLSLARGARASIFNNLKFKNISQQ